LAIYAALLLISIFIIAKLHKELEKSRLQTGAILNALPYAGFIKDTKGNLVCQNPQFEKLFANNSEAIAYFKKLEAQGAFEQEIQTTQGLLRFEIHPMKIYDSRAKQIATAAILIDISAAREIEKERETFVSTLTHDLKTPTISQIKALELLEGGALGKLNDTQNELVKNILDSCNYMNSMITTLLTVYKYEDEGIEFNFEKFDFVKLVNNCVDELEYLAIKNFQTIEKEFDADVLILDSDKTEIKRVINNILTNAINYSPKNSTIKIYIKREADSLNFTILNNGKILSEKELAAIFEKHPSEAKKFRLIGAGMGLYISQKIINALGGKMIAKSEKDTGNTFGFQIPVKTRTKSLV